MQSGKTAEASCNFCTFSEPTWSYPFKMRSPVRPAGGKKREEEKMKQTILKTTEPRPKSNQTPVIKMLMFTCSRLSRGQLLFVRSHLFKPVRLRCCCSGSGVYVPRSPRDSGCGDEWRAFVWLVQRRERGVKVHYVLRMMVCGTALIISSPECFPAEENFRR